MVTYTLHSEQPRTRPGHLNRPYLFYYSLLMKESFQDVGCYPPMQSAIQSQHLARSRGTYTWKFYKIALAIPPAPFILINCSTCCEIRTQAEHTGAPVVVNQSAVESIHYRLHQQDAALVDIPGPGGLVTVLSNRDGAW